MSQLSFADGQERSGSSSSASGAVGSPPVATGSVSMTPPPPEPPQLAAGERRTAPASRAVPSSALLDDELGPSLTSAQLMRAPFSERQLPDLSVSNEALLASLRPAVEQTLGTQVARAARKQGESALFWFGTRPSWLQATLSVVGGSVVGLSLVVAYAKTFHAPPEPELAAEPPGPARGVALAAAAPAALLAQRVVQPLTAAPAAQAAIAAQPTSAAQPTVERGAANALVASDVAANEPGSSAADDADADGDPRSEARKTGKRQRASHRAASASAKLPAWVQQQVKPQVQRATARERKAALREKRAAALREKKARRSRAKARDQE